MARKPTTPKITLKGELPELQLDMPLDKEKIEAIHRCLANGHLTIKMTKVDLAGGKLNASWLYD
ncbi:MAG TPA: hypothetical protein VG939_04610 [Caulobacteraceae bacterium]|nr:hypothetical protein [Caulobacteraceae bacterium]